MSTDGYFAALGAFVTVDRRGYCASFLSALRSSLARARATTLLLLACLLPACAPAPTLPAVPSRVVEWDSGPIAIYRADPQRSWEALIPLGKAGAICEVRSFVGFDRGALAEAGLDVAVGALRVYERSEHKEVDLVYDAWKAKAVWVPFQESDRAHVSFTAAQTGPNTHDGGLSTRVHFALRLAVCE